MKADEIRALAERLRADYAYTLSITSSPYRPHVSRLPIEAADALTTLMDQLEAKNALIALLRASLRQSEDEVEVLRPLLSEIAALKRHDPNAIRGFKRSTLTLNVPGDLLDRIDTTLANQKEG
jgi:hypothetical protein